MQIVDNHADNTDSYLSVANGILNFTHFLNSTIAQFSFPIQFHLIEWQQTIIWKTYIQFWIEVITSIYRIQYTSSNLVYYSCLLEHNDPLSALQEGCKILFTHHQNKGSQALSQGLAEEHMSDLKGPCQFLQNISLFSHDAVILGVSWGRVCGLTANVSQWLCISF